MTLGQSPAPAGHGSQTPLLHSKGSPESLPALLVSGQAWGPESSTGRQDGCPAARGPGRAMINHRLLSPRHPQTRPSPPADRPSPASPSPGRPPGGKDKAADQGALPASCHPPPRPGAGASERLLHPEDGLQAGPPLPTCALPGPHGHTLITVLPSLGDSVDSDSQPFPSCPPRLVVPREPSGSGPPLQVPHPDACWQQLRLPTGLCGGWGRRGGQAGGSRGRTGSPGRSWPSPWPSRGNPAPPQQPHVHPSCGQAATRPALIFKVLRPSCPPSTHTLDVPGSLSDTRSHASHRPVSS